MGGGGDVSPCGKKVLCDSGGRGVGESFCLLLLVEAGTMTR